MTGVTSGSAAARGGIREGDIVESFDGQPISEISDLQFLVRVKEFGDEAVVGIARNGTTLSIKVILKAPVQEGVES